MSQTNFRYVLNIDLSRFGLALPSQTRTNNSQRRYSTCVSQLSSFTLLVLTLLAASAVAWKPINKGDAEFCRKKNPDVAQAIASFCQRFPMNVPGRDARLGRYSKNTEFVARIMANKCNPAEKVPKSWCFKQFYNMCRNSKTKNATVLARYGGGGCQQWQLLRKNAANPG